MSECLNNEWQELLPEYLAEQLDAGTAMSVRRHLMGCSVCRDDLAIPAPVRSAQPPVPVLGNQRIGRDLNALGPAQAPSPPAGVSLLGAGAGDM